MLRLLATIFIEIAVDSIMMLQRFFEEFKKTRKKNAYNKQNLIKKLVLAMSKKLRL